MQGVTACAVGAAHKRRVEQTAARNRNISARRLARVGTVQHSADWIYGISCIETAQHYEIHLKMAERGAFLKEVQEITAAAKCSDKLLQEAYVNIRRAAGKGLRQVNVVDNHLLIEALKEEGFRIVRVVNGVTVNW